MSPARELLLRGAARVAPWGWAHPALGGHDRAPRVAGRPAEPPNAGPDHRRTRRGRHGHRASALPVGPGRPGAPNSHTCSTSGQDGSDLINGLRQGDFLAPARFQRQASNPLRTEQLCLGEHGFHRFFLQIRRLPMPIQDPLHHHLELGRGTFTLHPVIRDALLHLREQLSRDEFHLFVPHRPRGQVIRRQRIMEPSRLAAGVIDSRKQP